MLKRCGALLLCLALLLAGCTRSSAPAPDYVLTYADNQPAGYPTTQGAEYFAQLVAQQTEGRVVIQVKTGGSYGTEQELWQQLLIGSIDFARLSLTDITDHLPELELLTLPYLYRDAAHMWRVLDGEIGAEFLQGFARCGLVGLSWYDAGARSFYASRPITAPEDLAGRRVRVQGGRTMQEMVRLLGAEPVSLRYSEVYTALENGQIDAAENNWPAYHAMEHYKTARFYTVDQHSRIPEVQLASGQLWEQLPPQYRQILRDCAQQSAVYERQLWTQREAEARQAVLDAGCREIRLTAPQREAFRTRMQPLYDQYTGPQQALLERIQGS